MNTSKARLPDETLVQIAGRIARLGGWAADLPSDRVFWSNEVCDILDVPHGTHPTVAEAHAYYPPEWRARARQVLQACVDDGIGFDEELQVVSAEGSWCMADGFAFTMRYTVNFERATVDFDISRDHQLLVSTAGKAEAIDLPGDGYEGELAYFLDCVRTGRRPARVTAADAVMGLRILEAEQRSIESGQIERL